MLRVYTYLFLYTILLGTSLILLKNVKPKFWHGFSYFFAIGMLYFSPIGMGFWMYRYIDYNPTPQLFLFFTIIFHIFIFSKIIKLKYVKSICLASLAVLISIFVWEWYKMVVLNPTMIWYMFFTIDHRLRVTNYLVGTFLCVLYFYSLLKNDDNIIVTKEPAFWFVSGCLIFYATKGVIAVFWKSTGWPYRLSTIGEVVELSIFCLRSLCWVKAFICLKTDLMHLRR